MRVGIVTKRVFDIFSAQCARVQHAAPRCCSRSPSWFPMENNKITHALMLHECMGIYYTRTSDVERRVDVVQPYGPRDRPPVTHSLSWDWTAAMISVYWTCSTYTCVYHMLPGRFDEKLCISLIFARSHDYAVVRSRFEFTGLWVTNMQLSSHDNCNGKRTKFRFVFFLALNRSADRVWSILIVTLCSSLLLWLRHSRWAV